jgi:hypothetical protein
MAALWLYQKFILYARNGTYHIKQLDIQEMKMTFTTTKAEVRWLWIIMVMLRLDSRGNNIQNFRRYENKLGQNRYVYTVQVHDIPMPKGNAGYWLWELVVLDESFKEIDRQRMKE